MPSKPPRSSRGSGSAGSTRMRRQALWPLAVDGVALPGNTHLTHPPAARALRLQHLWWVRSSTPTPTWTTSGTAL